MSERVDHAAEAEKVNQYFALRELSDAEVIALGQMNATLALVEQMRAANLLSLAVFRSKDADGAILTTSFEGAVAMRAEAEQLIELRA